MTILAIVAIILEVLGISITAFGIGIELRMRSPRGFLFITIGAWLIAIGGLAWAKVL